MFQSSNHIQVSIMKEYLYNTQKDLYSLAILIQGKFLYNYQSTNAILVLIWSRNACL